MELINRTLELIERVYVLSPEKRQGIALIPLPADAWNSVVASGLLSSFPLEVAKQLVEAYRVVHEVNSLIEWLKIDWGGIVHTPADLSSARGGTYLPAIVRDGEQFRPHSVFTGQKDYAWIMERSMGITSGTISAMTRLVYSHVFDKYPNIKFITHHCGSSIPYWANRIDMHYDMYETHEKLEQGLAKPILDYYKMFYADSALHGNVSAMMCGYHFFGADHMLFGTDMPFDSQLGLLSTRNTIESIEQMDITDTEKKKIFEDNVKKLLRLSL